MTETESQTIIAVVVFLVIGAIIITAMITTSRNPPEVIIRDRRINPSNRHHVGADDGVVPRWSSVSITTETTRTPVREGSDTDGVREAAPTGEKASATTAEGLEQANSYSAGHGKDRNPPEDRSQFHSTTTNADSPF